MDKNKAFALYGVNMIEINGYNFKYANGYTIIKDKDELKLYIDCEVADEEQYKFLKKSLNDVLRGSNEFNISLYNDVRYADGTKKHIGGYKLKELTPNIIQQYYDKLDRMEKNGYGCHGETYPTRTNERNGYRLYETSIRKELQQLFPC